MSLETLKTRINYMGGDSWGRIKTQKFRSFQAALRNDYNSRPILTPLGEEGRALINDNNTKPDYDKRIISTDFAMNLQPGDVFECLDDNTHWMVYLQDLVEIAYLKAEIIRCRYQINIDGEDYWIYFQGPTETAVRWNLKRAITWNDLNFSGTVYIQKTKQTEEYFNRFTKLKIEGHTWQVKVRDMLTVPGIIELEVQEYYDSVSEDIAKVIRVDKESTIIGKQEVLPGDLIGYQIDSSIFNDVDSWNITGNDEVVIDEYQLDGQICIVQINSNATGTFTISYGSASLEVTIQEIEENTIMGATEVYPYDLQEYTVADSTGTYTINNCNAKILSQADGRCLIEITSKKKGSFNLVYTTETDTYTLPIKILSL